MWTTAGRAELRDGNRHSRRTSRLRIISMPICRAVQITNACIFILEELGYESWQSLA